MQPHPADVGILTDSASHVVLTPCSAEQTSCPQPPLKQFVSKLHEFCDEMPSYRP